MDATEKTTSLRPENGKISLGNLLFYFIEGAAPFQIEHLVGYDALIIDSSDPDFTHRIIRKLRGHYNPEFYLKPTAQVLGLGLIELDSALRKERNIENSVKGLLVADVTLKSEAAEKGIMPGDIILSVNQAPITSTEEFKKISAEAEKSTKKLFVFLKRGDKNYGVVLAAK